MTNNIPVLIESSGIIIATLLLVFGGGFGLFIKLKSFVGEQIVYHTKEDVDTCHPTIPKHYVSREELAEKLNSIEQALARIENGFHTDVDFFSSDKLI